MGLDQNDLLTRIVVSPDGKTFATAQKNLFSASQSVRILDVGSGKELHQFKNLEGWHYGLAYSPSGSLLAASSEDKVRLWQTDTGKEVLCIKEAGDRIAFSPDGKTLAASGKGFLGLCNGGLGRTEKKITIAMVAPHATGTDLEQPVN
jgi:WD40 repeat protein